ncbi:hypothetical protein BC628DRAFT_1414605 [Trametes gibbosa]|nr:hypothetical protein BC628DRAFT_1414605 [Trametes gibbosa]
MIIPNKSTIADEDIEVPYGRDVCDSSSTAIECDRGRDRSVDRTRDSERGRASVTGEEQERMRCDYEFKIATMQTYIAGLKRDLEDVQEREQKWLDGEQRVHAMEQELEEVRRRAEEKSNSMLSMQQELETLREERTREKDMAVRRQRQDDEEIQALRDQLEFGAGGGSPLISPLRLSRVSQLRSDMEGLLTELSDLSRRNDELLASRDNDHATIRDLDIQVKDYKRTYEQAKTELRSVKAVPTTAKGGRSTARIRGLVDIHVTAFVSSIDSLLTAVRSNAPTRVLQLMKNVVNTVTAVGEDVRAFERRPQRDRAEVDLEALQSLRERLEATLSNLVTAAKTHVTSAGMSSVSLLDAATSHVSATVTDIGKTIHIRKAEQEQFAPATNGTTVTNGYSPSVQRPDAARRHAH